MFRKGIDKQTPSEPVLDHATSSGSLALKSPRLWTGDNIVLLKLKLQHMLQDSTPGYTVPYGA